MRTIRQTFLLINYELSVMGRFWFLIGVGTLLAAAAMSFDFGSQVSLKHAAFLALLSVITAFAPETAYKVWNEGKKGAAIAIALVCFPMFVIEFYSHAGYTAGLRGVNTTDAKIQNIKWQAAQDSTADETTNLKLWQDQLAELQKIAPWAASVRADGLRGELAASTKAIELEARRGGCGPKCQKLMEVKGKIEERIAQAERAADLTKRIEATQRIIDRKRTAAAQTEFKTSAVAEQNAFLAKTAALVWTGDLKPNETVQAGAEQTTAIAMALAGTALPAFAFFLAGMYRIRTADEDEAMYSVAQSKATSPSAPHPRAPTALQIEAPAAVMGASTVDNQPTPPATAYEAVVQRETVPLAHEPAELPRHRIGKVRDTAFARRVEQVTRQYRVQVA